MDTFDFAKHAVKSKYPQQADGMQFGNSYEFRSGPKAPPQRIFVLVFGGMKYYFNSDGSVNNATNPTINYKRFQEFYEAHGTWASFIYPHPMLGNITVRFNNPLEDPDPILGGEGATAPFQIELKEQP